MPETFIFMAHRPHISKVADERVLQLERVCPANAGKLQSKIIGHVACSPISIKHNKIIIADTSRLSQCCHWSTKPVAHPSQTSLLSQHVQSLDIVCPLLSACLVPKEIEKFKRTAVHMPTKPVKATEGPFPWIGEPRVAPKPLGHGADAVILSVMTPPPMHHRAVACRPEYNLAEQTALWLADPPLHFNKLQGIKWAQTSRFEPLQTSSPSSLIAISTRSPDG